MHSLTTLHALTRNCVIGDVYDIRSDSFIAKNIFQDPAAAAAAAAPSLANFPSCQQEHTESNEILFDDTLSQRFAKLGISDELQVSILSGLVKPGEATSSYLREESDSPMSIRAFLIHTRRLSNEQFDPLSPDVKNLMSDEAIADPAGTHVVVGVSYGVTAIVRLQFTNVLGFNVDVVRADMEKHLKALVSADGPAHELFGRPNDRYTIDVFCDALVQAMGKPASFRDTATLLQNLSGMTNAADRKPLSYELMVLSALAERLNISLSSNLAKPAPLAIGGEMCRRIVELFSEFSATKKQLTLFARTLKKRGHNIADQEMTKVFDYEKEVDDEEQALIRSFSTVVPDVRAGNKKLSKLNRLIEKYEEEDHCAAKIKIFLSGFKQTIEKLSFVDALCKLGAEYIFDVKWTADMFVEIREFFLFYVDEASKVDDPEAYRKNRIVFCDLLAKERQTRLENPGTSRQPIMFFYIDCDKVPRPPSAVGTAIHHYKDGSCVMTDVALDCALCPTVNVNTAQTSVSIEVVTTRPIRSVAVQLPCPGSSCDETYQDWYCGKCSIRIEFGFDGYFYCKCGRAPHSTYMFKCTGLSHRSGFELHPDNALISHLRMLKPPREVNILLLGETGVGKSTWVNAFANYVAFSTIDEAAQSDSPYPIPSKFTMTNEKLDEYVITTGTDKNENFLMGNVATQFPKTYLFRYGNEYIIRIIDTPGIGDVRGVDQDRINVQNIMNHLANYDELHGICILLKPNNARVTVMFSFCIKELLTHLHRDACRNIVFCFTNTRGMFYRPGDTFPALRKVLEDNNDIGIDLKTETVYCIDNEAFRYLAASKQGVSFTEAESSNYCHSWKISVEEIGRMVAHVASLEPHKVKNMQSLNHIRRLVLELSRPLGELSSTIQSNINVAQDRREEIHESTKSMDEIAKDLYVPIVDMRTHPLDYPRTVCTSQGCVDYITVGKIQKVDYRSHCHEHCYIPGVETGTVNLVPLQSCAAMGPGPDFMCKICGCSWRVHMHIRYECEKFDSQAKDDNVEKLIEMKAAAIKLIEENLRTLETRIAELENEKKQITDSCAVFSCFLKKNSIAAYNDSIADYMYHLIKVEKGKVGAGGERKTLDGLQEMLSRYENEKEVLDAAIQNPNSSQTLPTTSEINDLIDKLYCLKHHGESLRKAVDVATSTTVECIKYTDTQVDLRRRVM